MPVSFANLQPATSNFVTGAGTSQQSTAQHSYVSGRTYLCMVSWFEPGFTLDSLSTSGVLWFPVGSPQSFMGGYAKATLMFGLAMASGINATTLSFSGATWAEYMIDEITGADTLLPVVQNAQFSSTNPYSASLNAFAAGNAAYMITTQDGTGSTFAPKSGWTAISADVGYHGSSAYKLDADLSPSFTGAPSQCGWALEIAAKQVSLNITNKGANSVAGNTVVNTPLSVTAGEYYVLAFMGSGAPTFNTNQLGISFSQIAFVSYRVNFGGLYVWAGFASTTTSGNLSFTTGFSGAGYYSIEAVTDIGIQPTVQILTSNNGNVTVAPLASENNAIYVYSNTQGFTSGFTPLSNVYNTTTSTSNAAQWKKGSYSTPLTGPSLSLPQALIAIEFAAYTPPPPPSNGRFMLLGVGS